MRRPAGVVVMWSSGALGCWVGASRQGRRRRWPHVDVGEGINYFGVLAAARERGRQHARDSSERRRGAIKLQKALNGLPQNLFN
jgi:hypothetical protein